MNNFWDTDTNEEVTGEFSTGGNFEPIPAGTVVNALCSDANWHHFDDNPEFVNLTWEVLEGDYKSRRVFQKVHVNDRDPKKAQKHIKMMRAIDHNAGGNLAKLGKKPDDADLARCLVNKSMHLRLDVYKTDKGKTGNWVQAVSAGASKPVKKTTVTTPDEDLPF